MGVYVYKISRTCKEIDGLNVYRSEYVYKPFGGFEGDEINERIERRHIGPTQRAWDKNGGCRDVLYTPDNWEAGGRVYRNPSCDCWHYDTPDYPGEMIGVLGELWPGAFTIIKNEETL